MTQLIRPFWKWYERHKTFATLVTTGLFFLQLVHLYWLTSYVVWTRLFETSLWSPGAFFQILIVLVDYTEIPAIIATSIFYINDLRKKFLWRPILFLILLNSQWLHLFWITDEFVVDQFAGGAMIEFPVWLAWVAIMIDYLELPVIYDTIRRSFRLAKIALDDSLKQ